jgi:hypothetical protein
MKTRLPFWSHERKWISFWYHERKGIGARYVEGRTKEATSTSEMDFSGLSNSNVSNDETLRSGFESFYQFVFAFGFFLAGYALGG